jgi:fermentation-respiration switch protein FrsA (DUF1100 family)
VRRRTVAFGAVGRHTRIAETRRLFDAARGDPKSLWIVPGAAHVDLHAFVPLEYERRVGGFVQDALRAG